MLKSYSNFYSDSILEKMVNESIIYFSPDLRKFLNELDSEISKELLKIEGEDVKPDITLITFDESEEGLISFTTMNNLVRNLNKFFKSDAIKQKFNADKETNLTQADAIWRLHNNIYSELDLFSGQGVFTLDNDPYIKGRNSVKIGKLVNKLFPGKFKDAEIEAFVNLFKSKLVKKNQDFEIVEGEDINYWYWYENYESMEGTIGNSCMAKKRGFFNIYTQNPDVCKLLILKNEDKIIGRALLWKIQSFFHVRPHKEIKTEWFMDRQYTIKDSDVIKFRNWANKNNYAYKTYNNHHNFSGVTWNGEDFDCSMSVDVKSGKFSKYPYMDTFRRLDPDDGTLFNDSNSDTDYAGCLILEDTDGGYDEVESGHYSEYYDTMISEDDAIRSEPLGDWIYRNSCVRVSYGSRGNRGYYPEDYDDVVYSDYNGEYYHVDDTVYSDYYSTYIYEEDAIKVVTRIYSDGSVEYPDDKWMSKKDRNVIQDHEWGSLYWYEFLSDRFRDWSEYEGILKTELVKNTQDEWIPKRFAVTVYKVIQKEDGSEIRGNEHLLEIDAKALGHSVDKNDEEETFVVDMFEYTKNIFHLLEDIKNGVEKNIKKYENILSDSGQQRLQFDEESEYKEKVMKNLSKYKERLSELNSDNFFDESLN